MKKMTEDSTAATLIWLLAVLALLASLLGCGPPRWDGYLDVPEPQGMEF